MSTQQHAAGVGGHAIREWLLFGVVAVLFVVLVTVVLRLPALPPMGWGFVAAALFMAIAMLVARSVNFLKPVGEDGRLSVPQLQFMLWTAIVGFAYGWLYAARAQHHLFMALGPLPANVLVAMGFSAVTVAGSKAITVTHLKSGALLKKNGGATIGDLFSDQKGDPDLAKTQMLFWTVLAAIIFMINVAGSVDTFATCSMAANAAKACKFPDIDTTLMALMGLGQGAYLGVKMVPPAKSWGAGNRG